MKELTTEEMIMVLKDFLKEAFCVNGTVEMKSRKDIKIPNNAPIFEINDKYRDKFYVMILKEQPARSYTKGPAPSSVS